MAVWRIAALVAVLFICVALATAPARLLGLLLPAEHLVLLGFSGSIWRGSVDSAALAVAGGFLQLGSMQWELSPWSLLILSPRAAVEARWGAQSVRADVSYSGGGSLRLRDTSANVPAHLIRQWVPVKLQGSLNFLTADLSLSNLHPTAGSGHLVWKNARWIGASSSQDLGDYALEFEVSGERHVEGKISTLSGPVQAAGTVSLAQQQYRVELDLHSDTGISAELGSALELVAQPVESGYRIELSGSF